MQPKKEGRLVLLKSLTLKIEQSYKRGLNSINNLNHI